MIAKEYQLPLNQFSNKKLGNNLPGKNHPSVMSYDFDYYIDVKIIELQQIQLVLC